MAVNDELARKLEMLKFSGQLTRREFMTRLAAVGVSAPLAELMWRDAKAAEPKRGGTFRIATGAGGVNDTLDPALIVNAFQSTVAYGALRNALTVINTNGMIEPDLAESFEPSDGARKWVFKLRRGVEFHNGKSLTPDDVIQSFNHHRGPESKSGVKSLLKVIDDIKADGPDTVVFTLKEGTADFAYFAGDWHLPIMPAKSGGDVDWQSGLGTGPFVLENFAPGTRAEMRRNDNYYHAGRPYFDSAVCTSVLDASARNNALVSNTVDYIDRCDPKTFTRLAGVNGVTTISVKGYSHYTAPMNGSVEPFNDVNVRLAVKFAIDREEIVKKILAGQGVPGNDNPVAEGIQYRINPQPQHVYDPDKAKFYLKKAGLSSLKLKLSAADAAFVNATDAGLLMQSSAAKTGIEIEVVREPNDGYWSNVWMKRPWCMAYWNGRPTCDWLFSQIYASNSTWNEMSWKNDKFDSLLSAAHAELDNAKRTQMYAEMQQLVHDDSGQIVLVFNNYLGAHSNRLQHADKIAPNLDHDGYRIYERWWFA
jgi:peptide/nickel transport system substrate-binding protein